MKLVRKGETRPFLASPILSTLVIAGAVIAFLFILDQLPTSIPQPSRIIVGALIAITIGIAGFFAIDVAAQIDGPNLSEEAEESVAG